MTSFAFMLVDVPAPPCMTSTTNSSRRSPERISSHAVRMAAKRSSSSRPSSWLVVAAASLTAASASTRYGLSPIGMPVIGKFSSARSVWMPQYASSGTSRSPIRSCSVRVATFIVHPLAGDWAAAT